MGQQQEAKEKQLEGEPAHAPPSEEVPDPDWLYLRVHQRNLIAGNIARPAFDPHGKGMSVDWSKYSTPEQTRDRVRTVLDKKGVPKDPANFRVARMRAGDVRDLSKVSPQQQVCHTPREHNLAHCDVVGNRDLETWLKFRRITTLVPLAALVHPMAGGVRARSDDAGH